MKKYLLLSLLFLAQWTIAGNLKVTEIMYNAQDFGNTLGDQYEFIELKNTSTTEVVNLTGYTFSEGIVYTFPPSAKLNPQQIIVLVANKFEFSLKYSGVTPYDSYTGGLKNSGEKIEIVDANLNVILSFEYNDAYPWPYLADGGGYSLVTTDANAVLDQDLAESWRLSADLDGSPGVDDPARIEIPAIVINEILPNTDLPLLDAIELYNPLDSAVDISGWILTDDPENLNSYVFPKGTVLAANSYVVVTETAFGTKFSLKGSGEDVYLYSAKNYLLTGYTYGFSYNAVESGRSVGPISTSDDSRKIVALETPTLGSANSGPRVGPLVISAINYAPVGSDSLEFLVIENISDTVVKTSSIQDANITWEVSGIGYKFPVNFEILAGEKIVLTDTTVQYFSTLYNLPSGLKVLSYTGSLSNAGESISISFPDESKIEGGLLVYPMVEIEEVKYNDKAPWPIEADSMGAYLSRIDLMTYGNEPNNWGAKFGVTPDCGGFHFGNLVLDTCANCMLLNDENFNKCELLGLSEEDEVISVFPNPVSDVLNIEISDEIVSKVIVNSKGLKSFVEFSNNKLVDVSRLSFGVYQLIVQTEKEVKVLTFVKN